MKFTIPIKKFKISTVAARWISGISLSIPVARERLKHELYGQSNPRKMGRKRKKNFLFGYEDFAKKFSIGSFVEVLEPIPCKVSDIKPGEDGYPGEFCKRATLFPGDRLMILDVDQIAYNLLIGFSRGDGQLIWALEGQPVHAMGKLRLIHTLEECE